MITNLKLSNIVYHISCEKYLNFQKKNI